MKKRIGKRRDPAKEQFWRRTVADQARSGLTVQAYCLRHGLKHWNFQWWRQQLVRRAAEAPATPTINPTDSPADPVLNSAFLPVRVVRDIAATIPGREPIEIVLPSGPTIRVPHGFDPHALDAVLSVLEARC